MGTIEMSKLKAAIAWRGNDNFSFLVYGAWAKGDLGAGLAGRIAVALAAIDPSYRASSFIATDEDWPCEIGVFELEGTLWPKEPESTFQRWLQELCSNDAKLCWMMFEGAFNDVRDIFQHDLASQIYAAWANCQNDAAEFALADELRGSADWGHRIAQMRERMVGLFPELF